MPSLTVQEFLRRKGGVGLLVVLNERGKLFSEIESEIEVTSDTISKRTDEAIDLGLVEMKAARRDDRTLTEYHLTDMGETLVREMSMKGVVSHYQEMRTHQRALEKKTSEVIKWIHENPSQLLEFPEAMEETLIGRTEEDKIEK